MKVNKTPTTQILPILVVSFILLIQTSAIHSQTSTRGIEGQLAPKWNVDTWFNLPDGKTTLDIDDYRGKVLYLYCFQGWCPGCLKYGFPTLQEVSERYANNDNVAFVAIQTVFEGYSANTVSRAKDLARDFNLRMPFGQSGEKGERSLLMSRYRTGGTPWTIIIDPKGVVRYNDFHLDSKAASKLIDKLLTDEPNHEQQSGTNH